MIRVMYTGSSSELKIRPFLDDDIDKAHEFIGTLLVNGYKFSVDTVKTVEPTSFALANAITPR